ncbi:MAG: acyl-CoA thioesterase [Succinivibrionaceae bacterium]|nr:acyl-CoA thioesterase [Succinivibrionaceae bacterium]
MMGPRGRGGPALPEAEVTIRVALHDTDQLGVVWHGNYLRYFERAREALMDALGYGYPQMRAAGLLWPVVTEECKYLRPLRLGDEAVVLARLEEWEYRIACRYEIRLLPAGEPCTRGRTVQMAVARDDFTARLELVPELCAAVAAWQRGHGPGDRGGDD